MNVQSLDQVPDIIQAFRLLDVPFCRPHGNALRGTIAASYDAIQDILL